MDLKHCCEVAETERAVIAQAVKPARKKVILRDCDSDNFCVLLTNEQIDLLDFLKKNCFFDHTTKWEILSDEKWEKI